MTGFLETPRALFPLNDDEYRDIDARLVAAARGFARMRTSDADAVQRRLESARGELMEAWNTIQGIERREKELQ
ncbi:MULTISPECIES: hypothetical protein [Rhizobium]|jgi:hypothetical protein|uniref:hypothetical protein n=1 Tax=Rhizobium TaxID=379 RepID=UPI00102F859B|nr:MULTISPECIES: hypothetical protein [Rhizobium]MBY5826317.1 hypothetical protein [Rhizobium leguminosarum]TBA44970.1 hypothetical protein ELH62_22500 [Rhizobium ruizarguesonis]